MEDFIEKMKYRFPRLQQVSFVGSKDDEYAVSATPAGQVETVYFALRQDFENAVTALAYKLEPRPIPPSMGAIFISGLLDHVKMEKTAIVILSRGGYSGLSREMISEGGLMGLADEKWVDVSLTIRKYHELSHFVQRKLYPENANALRDEIKADMVGIIEALGTYDVRLARLFLGIEGDTYRRGGRLENYVSDPEDINAVCDMARAYVEHVSAVCREAGLGSTDVMDGSVNALTSGFNGSGYTKGRGFDILMKLEEAERNQHPAFTPSDPDPNA